MKVDLTAEDWKYRIVNADAHSITLINMELILADINLAKEQLDKGDVPLYRETLNHAKELLMVLIQSVDGDKEMGPELQYLYFRVNQNLIDALFKKEPTCLNQAEQILETLYEPLKIACADMLDKAPVISNAQQVYTGLTYGKSSLNDVVDGGSGRGFKA